MALQEENVPVDLLEGQNLGKYRVLEPLGRGGMARVYRAYHPQLDRYVAIKVLRSDLVEEEEFLARFKREARAVASLRHPNIVQVFDFDARDDIYYMVMELLEGDTLRRRLDDYRARTERMPWGEMVRVQLDVLDGLAYAHGEGMIHRDIKPANILLTKRGQAVLTDFGIAQIVGGTRYTVSGALMGTLNYMAPEQGLEGHCDARSDVYSLGIVFYEMLTGEPPFDAETPLAILMKHVNDPLPLPRQMDPTIPAPFERVVLKALAKRPQDRYQSAEEMAETLKKAAQEAAIDLPGRISLPLSFTTSAAPSESVAVLSGRDRNKVVDVEFAADDTDARLSQRLAMEAEERPVPATPPQPAVSATPAAAPAAPPAPRSRKGAIGVAALAVSPEASERVKKVSQSAVDLMDRSRRSRPAQVIVNAVGLMVVGNLAVIFVALLFNDWGSFGRGWPFELLLAGVALSQIMAATGSRWLLIPTGIILGNGYLFSFYALTDMWYMWGFLWPLEPLLVIGTVWLAIRWSERQEWGEAAVRRLAQRLRRPTLILIPIVVLVGMLVGS